MNPLLALKQFDQAVWLDYIRRSMLTSGELERLVKEDGLKGVTSNPAIFEKAIAGSTDYTDAILHLGRDAKLDTKALYEELAIADIQGAADVLYPVYQQTDGVDGYVSLEVSPFLARDTKGTIEEAHRLWQRVGRKNLMIKVPGTDEGMPAIRQLIEDGINVNVTLLFSLEAYQKSAEAYLAGLEARAKKGLDVHYIGSVASFFISRIDSLVDSLLGSKTELHGKAAIANAKLAYQYFKELENGVRWQALLAKGARPQRLLWASTSTKNPKYRDVIYVETLVGPKTVNTLPPATFDAFRDHGHAASTLGTGVDEAREVMRSLEQAGISFQKVTDQLLDDGIKIFADAFEQLLNAVEGKRQDLLKAGAHEPDHLPTDIIKELDSWAAENKVHRLWARDASLWTNSHESDWMGWLGICDAMRQEVHQLEAFAESMRQTDIKDVVVLGMGGSSIAASVFANLFGHIAGWPKLRVLDSTDPAQIANLEAKIDVSKALFVVSSKSGTTIEPNLLAQYFLGKKGGRFIAITDPGSKLETFAQANGFLRVFYGVPSIGGRYAALSNFGLVPAALAGIKTSEILSKAEEMVHACAHSVLPRENPGVMLGIMLGVWAKKGRDKVTIVTSAKLRGFGAWLEQLLAESTGKNAKGLIPIDLEPVGSPDAYGQDRVFVQIGFAGDSNERISQIEAAGHPVIRIELPDLAHLGGEFFRWQIATAVCGSILSVNPFDQPDVESAKAETHRLLELGQFKAPGDQIDRLADHLARVQPGSYCALLAFVEQNEENTRLLQSCRETIAKNKKAATVLGFGPSYLHSTGQLFKGGPKTGVFIQITCDDAKDLPIPGQRYTFGQVKQAQAQGDFAVMQAKGLPLIRVHLKDTPKGLRMLKERLEQICK